MTERLQTMSEDFSGRGDWANSTTELFRAPQHPESQSTAIEGLEIEENSSFLAQGSLPRRRTGRTRERKNSRRALGAMGTTEG